ncbi:hypothetical protein ROA7023_03168 [Roseisalinus antarcticus]|uniref:Uncharacterized protein n=2 Tax=Roseisalinus antarcticus TaxID=254357 RepID=A0A1Y5TLT6_9RHOB|nr:hypothetical protein ROA7023_03168 [Roseisalinus antarcticus]
MVDGFLLPTLALVTIGAAIVVALWSKSKTRKMSHVREQDKSSLATDGPGPAPVRSPGKDRS